LESTICGKMEEMERKRKETEDILCLEIYNLSTQHEERERDFKITVQALRGEIEELKKRISDVDKEYMEDALH